MLGESKKTDAHLYGTTHLAAGSFRGREKDTPKWDYEPQRYGTLTFAEFLTPKSRLIPSPPNVNFGPPREDFVFCGGGEDIAS